MNIHSRYVLVQLLQIIMVAYHVQCLCKDYNPLESQPQYKLYRSDGWKLYLTEQPLSAAVTNYRNGNRDACVRVVTFMAHGAVLGHEQGECGTPDRFTGLHTHGGDLRFFDTVLVRQLAVGRFLLVQKEGDGGKCSRTTYVLGECSDSAKCPRPEVKESSKSSENHCRELDGTKLPQMLLLSTSGAVGQYQPVAAEWMTFNPWEPLGFVSREYRHQRKCFRLVVVTSRGRALHNVKVTCGPVSGVAANERFLLLGNTLYARVNSDNMFVVLINTFNSGCVKKAISLDNEGGNTVRKVTAEYNLTMENDDCKRLVEGTLESKAIPRENINKLKTTPIKETFTQDLLTQYTPVGDIFDYNIVTNLGMMVQTYQKGGTKENIVTLLTNGVPVLPVFVEAGHPKDIVIRDKVVYYGNEVSLTKLHAEHGYQVLKRLPNGKCARKPFHVNPGQPIKIEKDDEIDKSAPGTQAKATRKETSTTDPQPNILDSKECRNLFDGTHLKGDKPLALEEMEKLEC